MKESSKCTCYYCCSWKSEKFTFSSVTPADVAEEINILNRSKAIQEDDLPVKLLKDNKDFFGAYIAKYFNDFLKSANIPNCLKLASLLFKRTENMISFIDIGSDDIAKIIHNLDPNKAHGHDISICMLEICGNSIYKPLQLIFRSCIENGKFPS